LKFHSIGFKTVVGGLSSIDYDVKNDLYYFICDDRAVYNDARFYTAKIHLGTNKIDSLAFKMWFP
jgi:hypothetical protein